MDWMKAAGGCLRNAWEMVECLQAFRRTGKVCRKIDRMEERQMKLISWNVNGLRACVNKNFMEEFQKLDADFFCLQETKLQEGQIDLELPGYEQYWNYAKRKGYSGTAIFTKHTPLSVAYGMGIEEHDQEGRVITLEYDRFYLVTVYTPNSQNELKRLSYRMEWEDAFRGYLGKLAEKKGVIVCGDMNVAHEEIDLKNPKTNRNNAGFTDQEREKMTELLDSGFIDSFRNFYPDAEAGGHIGSRPGRKTPDGGSTIFWCRMT